MIRCLTVTSSDCPSYPHECRVAQIKVLIWMTLPTGTEAKTPASFCWSKFKVTVAFIKITLEESYNYLSIFRFNNSASHSVLHRRSVFSTISRRCVETKSYNCCVYERFRNHCNQIWAITHWQTSRLRRRLDAVSSVRCTRPGTC